MKISIVKMYSTAIYILINIVIMLIFYSVKENIVFITYLSLMQLVISIYFIHHNKKKLFTTITIFLLLSYLFHFGQSLITAFNFNDIYSHRSVLKLTTYDLYIRSHFFAMLSHFFVSLGNVYLFKTGTNELFHITSTENERTDLAILRIISIVILLVSLAPLIYMDWLKISAASNTGYLSTYETYQSGINKYLNLISQFARPAITMLMISYKNKSRQSKLIFLTSTLYFLLMMISGDRGTNMIYIITNIFVYFKVIGKIKLRTVIIMTIMGYFLIGILSSITVLRTLSDFSFDTIKNVLTMRSEDGFIYNFLREFGSTSLSLVYSMKFTGSYHDFNFGETYLVGLLAILPKLPDSIVQSLATDMTFTKSFPIGYQYSLGGSYLGELYFNFGWIGTVMSFFVGQLIGYVDYIINKSIENNKWVMFSIVMVFFPKLILWVRNFYVELFFEAFWVGLIAICIFSIYKRKLR